MIEPKVFSDHRGFFYESYNEKIFKQKTGHQANFIQDNHSKSTYGTLRGLHFQLNPFAQSKLIRVIQGEILDIAVDIRKNSATFGEHLAIILSDSNKKQFFIPKGFAHGFVVLSKTAEVLYKTDAFYHPESECGIKFDDAELGIDWLLKKDDIILSEKDKVLLSFNKVVNNF